MGISQKKVLALLFAVAGTLVFSSLCEAQYTITSLTGRSLKQTVLKVANAGASVPGVFCSTAGCESEISPFPAFNVSCPGTAGTCTFEFNVCARIAPKTGQFDDDYFESIRIDGAVPSPGPVDLTLAIPPTDGSPNQENYCATSVASGISLGSHSISMALGAADLTGNGTHADIPNVVFTVRVYKP